MRGLPGGGGLGWAKVWREMTGLNQMVTDLEGSLCLSPYLLSLHFFCLSLSVSLSLSVFLFLSPLSASTSYAQCQGN